MLLLKLLISNFLDRNSLQIQYLVILLPKKGKLHYILKLGGLDLLKIWLSLYFPFLQNLLDNSPDNSFKILKYKN